MCLKKNKMYDLTFFEMRSEALTYSLGVPLGFLLTITFLHKAPLLVVVRLPEVYRGAE